MRFKLSLYLLFLLCIAHNFQVKSQTKADSLEQIFKRSTDPSEKAELAADLVFDVFKERGDLKAANYYFSVAKNQSEIDKNWKVYVKSFNNKGVVFYYSAIYDSADVYFQKALELSIQHNEKEGECKALNNLGSMNHSHGFLEKSLEYYIKGLKKEAEYGFIEGTYISLNNLGYVYNALGIHEKARTYFRKAMKRAMETDETVSLIYSFDGISNSYDQERKKDSAIYYQIKSYSLSRDLNDLNSQMYSALNLTGLYNDIKQYSEALHFATETRSLVNQFDNKDVLISCYGSYASIYLNRGSHDLAALYIDSAISISHEVPPSLLKDLYLMKAQVEFKQKHPEQAYVYLKKYIDLKDSIYNIDLTKTITEMQGRFDVSQKEKQIELLNEKDKQKQIVIYFTFAGGILVLGIALYIFRISRQRKKLNLMLEFKNKQVSEQKHLIEEKNKEILDSIHYAKRIQNALLAHKEFIESNFNESFVLFKPKDIVSGDFYWATLYEDRFYLAVCDSTGHGVPGAFMSLLNMGFLSEAIKEKNIKAPNEVLNYVRKRLVESISKDGQKDGMDGILICFDKKNRLLTYSAAHNKPVLIRNKEIKILDADKMPVGQGERDEPFSLFTINSEPGDIIYLYTDGYADQFGGEKGKKFKYKKLDELLLKNSTLPVSEQLAILTDSFNAWKGPLEQVDDVLIAGIKL